MLPAGAPERPAAAEEAQPAQGTDVVAVAQGALRRYARSLELLDGRGTILSESAEPDCSPVLRVEVTQRHEESQNVDRQVSERQNWMPLLIPWYCCALFALPASLLPSQPPPLA